MTRETQLVPIEEGSAPAPVTNELAVRIVAALETIAERLNLQTPTPATARRVRGARTVPREAVLAIIAAVEDLPRLQALNTLDPAQAHEVVQAQDSLRRVAQTFAMLHARTSFTVEAQWADVTRRAMQTFAIATTLSKSPDHPELVPYVANISRILDRRNGATGKKRKKEG